MNSFFIDSDGYIDEDSEKVFKTKYQGYCQKCHHTYWKNEVVEKDAGGFNHLDCLVALADRTPRRLSPKYERELKLAGLGIPNKAILKKKAKKRIYQNGTTN